MTKERVPSGPCVLPFTAASACACANGDAAGGRTPGAAAATDWDRPANSRRAAASPRDPSDFAPNASSGPGWPASEGARVYAANRKPFVLL